MAAVLRIGLSMDEIRGAEARMSRRMVVMSILVVILGGLAMVYIMAQQNLHTMERKYTSIRAYAGNILAQMRDGVVTVDPQGRVSMCNIAAAEMLGVKAGTLEGHSVQAVEDGSEAVLKDIFAGADGISEVTLGTGEKKRRIVAVSVSTTVTPSGAVESRTALLRDLTESRRLELELRRKDRVTAMGELASGVAHEIRNPLNAIGMIAQRMQREFTPRRDTKEYRALIRVMQDETGRVNAIIRQFLEFARPPALDRRPVPLPEFTDHIRALFAAQASERGVEFTVAVQHPGPVSIDREQMTQAVLNLLQNALAATPPGGRIDLLAVREESGARIVITDSGEGIPPANLEKIFNLYFTTRPDGTGVGLPITQQIVSQHGGTIDITSTPGAGTVCTIEFPNPSVRSGEAGRD